MKNTDPPLDIQRKFDDSNCGGPTKMILDNKTLKNLDVIPDGERDGSVATLFSVVDKTLTPIGKRLLRQWLCLPLVKIEDILTRQEIIKYFEQNLGIVQKLSNAIKGIPDLEKLVSSIHMSGIKLPTDHPEERAIYYEQPTYAKKKVAKLTLALESLGKIQTLFKDKLTNDSEAVGDDTSVDVFRKIILDPFPNMAEPLQFFKEAFDAKVAESTGKIVPKKGVDKDYDQAKKDRKELEQDLDDYLTEQKRFFGSDVKYFGSGNNMYQLEIRDDVANKKVNSKYTLSSQKKGFKRFTTSETLDFLARHVKVEEDEAEALSEVNRKIFFKFSEYKNIWQKAISLTVSVIKRPVHVLLSRFYPDLDKTWIKSE